MLDDSITNYQGQQYIQILDTVNINMKLLGVCYTIILIQASMTPGYHRSLKKTPVLVVGRHKIAFMHQRSR